MGTHPNFKTFETDLVAEHGLADRTADTYAGHAKRACKWFAENKAGTDLLDLTTEDLRDYLRHLVDNDVSTSYRRLAIFSLRWLYTWLCRDHDEHVNPAQRLKVPAQDKATTDYYTPAHFVAMLAAVLSVATIAGRLGQHRRWLRARVDHALLATLRYTGIRLNEVFTLRTADVNLDNRRLTVHGKGGKTREVPISKPLAYILKRYLNDIRALCPTSAWLFANPDGYQRSAVAGRYAPRAIFDTVRRYATNANIPGRHHPHRIRHGVATEFVRGERDLETLRQMLGHADLSTTSRYLHLDNDDVANAVDHLHGDHDNPDLDNQAA